MSTGKRKGMLQASNKNPIQYRYAVKRPGYNSLQIKIKKVHSSLQCNNGKQKRLTSAANLHYYIAEEETFKVNEKQTPLNTKKATTFGVSVLLFDDLMFPEDIEEYFHQGLLSQPSFPGNCDTQTMPNSLNCLGNSCSRKAKLHTSVPDVQSIKEHSNVYNSNSQNKGASKNKARSSMGQLVKNVIHIQSQDIKIKNFCSNKKDSVPSETFIIPETPKLKVKQYHSQGQASYAGSRNKVVCVPETPYIVPLKW